MTLRIVFFATDDIALPAFHALLGSSAHEVVALVSQPDRPAGRGLKLKTPTVVELARERGIPVLQRENLKGKLTREKINSFGQDINTVFAFGCYIPSVIFDHPKYRSINIHPSLLPCHRGANPIRSAISCGDETTGVSIQYVEKVMDTGDVLASWKLPIGPDEIYDEIAGRLSIMAADLLIDTLSKIEAGDIHPAPQAECDASECCKWGKEDTIIKWNDDGIAIHNRIRAFSTSPGASACFRGKTLKILRTSFQPTCPIADIEPEPGTIMEVSKRDFTVMVHGGSIIVREVKPEGKQAMDAAGFINGYKPMVGEKLG